MVVARQLAAIDAWLVLCNEEQAALAQNSVSREQRLELHRRREAWEREAAVLRIKLDRRGAELLFQVLTEREETSSIAIASSESFSGWTKTFTDPRLCAADRGPPHLRRQHHRDWHHFLPACARPRATR